MNEIQSDSNDVIECVDESYHRKNFEHQKAEAKALFFDGPSVRLRSEFQQMRGVLERLANGRLTLDQGNRVLPWITTELAWELIRADRNALLASLRESPNLSQFVEVLTGRKNVETVDPFLIVGSPKEVITMMLLMSGERSTGTLQILNEAFGTQIDQSSPIVFMGKKVTVSEALEVGAQKARERLEESLREARRSCERIEQNDDLKDAEELNKGLQ